MTTDPELPEDGLPAQIGSYRLVRRLGKGGQGAVYLAEDRKLRRQVALKLLPPSFASSAEARLRLEREAEAAARVNHACVAKIFEIGEDGPYFYLAMEYVEGSTLSTYIHRSRAAGAEHASISGEAVTETALARSESDTERRAASRSQRSSSGRAALDGLVAAIESSCRGLQAAHDSGLVHRDLKPANIMIRPDGSPAIIDFGLAHDDDSEGVTLTRTGQFLGTLAYMSPEQIRGERDGIDRRSDVYSMGVTLFECCTLLRPFEGGSRHELIQAITTEAPRRPRSINPRLTKDLEAIILTALDRDPRRRYQSAAELADDLGRYQRREPIRARPVGPVVRSARWVRRNALLSTTTGVIIFALVGIAVVLYQRNRDVTEALEETRRERAEKVLVLDENARLADEKRLEAAIVEAETLVPPRPELIVELEDWQREYGPLARRLETYRKDLDEIRGRALPYSEEERRRDFGVELAELEGYEVALRRLEEERIEKGDLILPAQHAQRRDDTYRRIAELETVLAGRRSWRFAAAAEQLSHDLLARLVAGLEHFAHDETGCMKVVERRIADCRAIHRVTIEKAAEAWSACRERIRTGHRYSGLDLAPQLGLIPLGPDPDSGLEEFLHWLTHAGPLPRRDPTTGRFEIHDELGVVLVLVPGGSFLMGAQRDDRNGPNYDPRAFSEEGPPHEVTLGAYFLSKYEMTQAQWLRASGENPSQLHPGFRSRKFGTIPTLRHPVERISWQDCRAVLPRVDLVLPTEAEWERAARADRTDLIFAGTSSIEDLNLYGNITGSEAVGILGGNMAQRGHRDDFVIHAPVGSLLPNDFGFHDMTGNLWEFCLDGSSDSYREIPDGRGLRDEPTLSANRRIRGGAFLGDALRARLAFRFYRSPGEAGNAQGVRPARLIQD